MKFECCKNTSDGAAGALTCFKCKHCYHIQCLFPTDKKPIASDLKKSWICPECSLKQPKQAKNDNTPIRASSRQQLCSDNITLHRGGSSTVSPPAQSAPDCGVTTEMINNIVTTQFGLLKDDIRAFVRSILSEELKPIKDEITNIKDSLCLFNQQFENLTKRIDKVEIDLKAYKKASEDLNPLKLSVANMENQNNNSEQWSRRSNIEIYGIPEKKNENLFQILHTISERTNCTINPASDIDFITRVYPKHSDPKQVKPIIVRFLARYKKDDFLSEVRKLKLKASDIGYATCDNIYIYIYTLMTI